MIYHALSPNQSLNKAYRKEKVARKDIELFKSKLREFLESINEKESEEHVKNNVTKFLYDTYYQGKNQINTKGRIDLAIYEDKKPVVIIEAKRPNSPDMVSSKNLNAKAMHELMLYYLRERIEEGNNDIKFLVATNMYEWFVFDALVFEKLFYKDHALTKDFNDWKNGRKSGDTTDFFYTDIAFKFLKSLKEEITFTKFDLREIEKVAANKGNADDHKLIPVFKFLSPAHLLKQPFANDSNSLDTKFYSELLHIIGLEEKKDGGKKIIQRKEKPDPASLLENAIATLVSDDKLRKLPEGGKSFGATDDERLFNVALELCITWINRVLFLKLLEGQLLIYHGGDKAYRFLDFKNQSNFDQLNKLFFDVLAKVSDKRPEAIRKKYAHVPYLNSSLFDFTPLEEDSILIKSLDDSLRLKLASNTVLKSEGGKKREGDMPTLQYLFEFLDAYDFASEGKEEIQEENKGLINASVLGLIFEKINGYKDGSFFTPGFITMYMCRETIRRAVIQKFNEAKGWKLESFDQLYNEIKDIKEANAIVNSLKICDPAVGSGHFLVSALNEIIAIKSELNILSDRSGKVLRGYSVEVINDELIISIDHSEFFEYKPGNKESQRVQEALFHEKQTIIENCLFGVDINPNSVKICRLRLWIELLKNAYYTADSKYEELETLPNIDINIKQGNSLISRFSLDADLSKALKSIKYSIDDYRSFVSNYKNATDKEEKRGFEKLINQIKSDFRTEIGKNDPLISKKNKLGGELYNLVNQAPVFEPTENEKKEREKKKVKLETEINKLSEQIEEIKNSAIYKDAFEWRFEFPEVLDKEGNFKGFDMVIGNPPWGANIGKRALQHIKGENSDIIVRMVDSFMFFINKSFALKANTGFISMIIPDVLLYQLDNEKLREKILKTVQLIEVINLGDNIFQDVARASAIFVFGSFRNNLTTIGNYRKKYEQSLETIELEKINTDLYLKLPYFLFATENLDGYALLTRLKGNKLSDLIDDDGIQRGVSPDFKDAFVISDEIVKMNKLEKDWIKTTITGGNDVRKYVIVNKSKKLIYTSRNDDPKVIPNIVNFISGFKSKITCKEVSEGKHPFYALHRERDEKIFTKTEKIVGVITGDRIIVSIDNDKTYPTDGLYVFSANKKVDNKFLVAVLNSKLITYLYRLFSFEEGRVLAQIKPSILQDMPLPEVSSISQKPFIDMVNRIISVKSKDAEYEITQFESEINQMVYQLYKLTDDEIKIVEGN